jgi:hypothetical protein
MKINSLNNLEPGSQTIFTDSYTEDTVNAARKLIQDSVRSQLVRITSEDILRGVAERDWQSELKTIFRWVQINSRYMQDIAGVEMIKTPERQIKEIMSREVVSGDCDDLTVLLGALFVNAGYFVRLVIIRSPWNRDNSYNHIFLQAQIPGTDSWVTADPIVKDKPMGWEAESVAKKVYNVQP